MTRTQRQREHVETVGATISQESQRLRRSVVRGAVGFGALWALIVQVSLWLGPSSGVMAAAMCALFVFFLLAMSSSRSPRRRRRSLTARLAGQRDVRSIGPLIDALQFDDNKTREDATDALILLLPQLKASDAALLNERQRARLCLILSRPVENVLFKDVRDLFRPARSRAIEIRVAILQAFEQVGDRWALPVVQRLARNEAKTDGERRIQKAAIDCLPALQLRAEQQQSNKTLLRASQPSEVSSDVLLRAATDARETAPEELVRASEPASF